MPGSGKLKSPEQLNSYIRVTSPGAWLILSAVLVFLAGFFVWIFMGELEVSFASEIFTAGGRSLAFVSAGDASRLKPGMTARMPDYVLSGTVESVSDDALTFDEISEITGENTALLMKLNPHDRLIQVTVNIPNAPANISRAVFVTDRIKPLSFLFR